jgi:hypothetical protein
MTSDTPKDNLDFSTLQAEAETAEASANAERQATRDALIAEMHKDWELEGIYLGVPPEIDAQWQLPKDRFTQAQLAERWKESQLINPDGSRRIACSKIELGRKDDEVRGYISIVWNAKATESTEP